MENSTLTNNEVLAQNRAIALAYVNAVAQREWDNIVELLHSDVAFVGPFMELNSAERYLQALKKLSCIILDNNVKRVFAEDDEVCILYDLVTDTPVGAVPCTEWLNIENGRIVAVQLMFDRHRWPEVMVEMGKRLNSK